MKKTKLLSTTLLLFLAVCQSAFAQPANDYCSSTVTLTQSTTCSSTLGTTVGASQSFAATCAGTADDDVWYQFVALSSNPTIAITGSSAFDGVLELLSNACSNVSISCVDATATGGTETINATGLTVGTTYYVKVYSYGSGSSYSNTFNICVYGPPATPTAPANDACANATTLTQTTTCSSTLGTTLGATQSIVGTCAGTSDDDVWYKFVALSTNPTIAITGSSAFDGVLELLSGACMGTSISCADATATGGTETISATGLTIGSTYLIRVYSFGSTSSSSNTFNICVYGPPATPTAPANDACANATTLTQTTTCSSTLGTTVGATQSIVGTCAGTSDDDVWYKFVALSANPTISITGSSAFDGVLELLSGACMGTSISCTDATATGGTETISATGLTIGSTYLIRVYSFGSTSSSSNTFNICVYGPPATPTAPANDACANATTLTQTTTCSSTLGTTVGATQSMVGTCTGTSDDDVWYQFVALSTNPTIAITGSSSFDGVLQLLSGACTGTSITCADATATGGSETINATGLTIGSTYLVRVYSYGSGSSYSNTFNICVYGAPPAGPANNECSGAISLTQTTTCTSTSGTTVGATASISGTCAGTADDDVWYKFVATSATPTITVVGSSSFDAVIDLRSGACTGTNISCADGTVSGGTETINATGLTIGSTYYVRVYSWGSGSSSAGTFTICVFGVSPSPANNDCAGATTLTQTATCTTTNGTTVGATSSISGTCAGTADDDVWYKFVAVTATPTITVVGSSSFDAVVDLRSGACSGTNVTCADATATAGTETINATGLTIGNTYYVRVYSYGSATSSAGTFTICVFGAPPAPANNDCSGAITLTQTATCSPTSGTTVGATSTISGTCAGTADDDVWYKFVATSTTPTITVVGSSSFDAVVDFRSGACTGTNVSCADATASGGTETINASGLIIGNTYYVRVYSYGSIASNAGTFTICVFGAPPAPSNDDCSGAITLTQTTNCSPTSGTTINATSSITGTCAGTADDDVWYKFVAVTATPTITVVGSSSFDAVIDLRSGACTGTNVSCADASASGGTETINATGLTIGNTYYVRVYSYGSTASSAGTFTVCVFGAPLAPANNDCSGATTLTQTATCSTTNGTTVGATASISGTCAGTADDDVWYKFVAVTATPTITVVGSSSFDAVIDLRSGACTGANVSCADASASGGSETINATGLTIGNTYYVRVYSYGATVSNQGIFTICVFGAPPAPANDDCSGAITLTESATCNPTNGTTVAATQSLAAITCGGSTGTADDDVWYKFVASSATPTITVVGSSSFDAVIDLRSGACNGTNINCSDVSTSGGGTETVNATGLTIGSTYYVRVYSWGSTSSSAGAFTICVSDAQPAPINDDCTGAITLTQTTTCSPTSGTTVAATQSLAAITCGGSTGTADDDVWYKFVATSLTPTITVVGSSSFDAVVDLRSGACNGTNISCSDASTSGGGTETINATGLTVGSTYYIRVYSYGSTASSAGAFTICVFGAPSAPVNDECSGAITLTQTATCSPTNGTTVAATVSMSGTCSGTSDDDVWYKFVATSATPTITVAGSSSFDAVIDLRSGACTGTNVSCADATASGGTEIINSTGLTIGATYYVRVYSYGSTASSAGAFTICVNDAPATPVNDDCSGAITLTQTATCTPTNGTTAGATTSISGTCAGTADDDVWFKFVATTTTPTITVVGSTSFDAVIDLRSGACNGTNVSCADATANGGTETINATALTIGSTYYVRVYSFGSTTSSAGTFTICVFGALPPPANNDCSGAISLTQTTTCNPTSGTTIGATLSLAGTCTGTADDDVWYSFVATTATPIITVVGSSSFDAVINLRSGACTGTSVSCADATSIGGTEIINSTGLTVGSTYYVRVYSYDSTSTSAGAFTICVNNAPPPPANDDCSGAINLTQGATCNPTNGTTVGGTLSIAGTCSGTADDDVWYKFVATSATPIISVVGSSSFDAVIDLRSGACTGTNVSCADGTGVAGTEVINGTGLTIGSTYYVRVYSYGSTASSQGTFTICVYDAPPPPANNDCTGAITLTQTATCTPTNGTTVAATNSITGTCGGGADDDVWYKFVATSTNPTITVVGNGSFDAVVNLLSGACNGTSVSCADTSYSGGTEMLHATSLTIGSTYYVRVYSYGSASSSAGTFTICVYGTITTGIDAMNGIMPDFTIYPNPANNELTIETTNSNSKLHFEVVNLVGQSVFISDVENKTTIDCSSLPNGIYMIKLFTNETIMMKKFVKQ